MAMVEGWIFKVGFGWVAGWGQGQGRGGRGRGRGRVGWGVVVKGGSLHGGGGCEWVWWMVDGGWCQGLAS